MRPEMTWQLPIPGMIALILFVGLFAARYSWRTALGMWWGSVLLLILIGAGRGGSAAGAHAHHLRPGRLHLRGVAGRRQRLPAQGQ
jgi:hypothetical protein